MSLEAYVWAASLPLSACSGTEFRVLLKLADRADQLGRGAYPGVPSMAAELECTERTVYRALAELRIKGLIRPGDQRFVQHVDSRYRPTVWDVLTTALVVIERMESRGDICVTPDTSRGDRNVHPGVTTGVTTKDIRKEPSLEPSYQDSLSHLQSQPRAKAAMT